MLSHFFFAFRQHLACVASRVRVAGVSNLCQHLMQSNSESLVYGRVCTVSVRTMELIDSMPNRSCSTPVKS